MPRDDQHLQRTVGVLRAKGKWWLAVVGVILGVALLWWGNDASVDDEPQDGPSIPSYHDPTQDRLLMEEYRHAIEDRICHLCQRLDGVGEVWAVVNLQGGFSYVYATDVKSTTAGESREYIIIGSGEEERLVYLSQEVPEILGVGVVLDGGDDPMLQKEIISLISSAFGVSSHQIYVSGGG